MNYKVVDLVESYKIRIKFIFIRVHKKVTIFWKHTDHTPWATMVADATILTAVAHSGLTL
jgi:hypothetical protein